MHTSRGLSEATRRHIGRLKRRSKGVICELWITLSRHSNRSTIAGYARASLSFWEYPGREARERTEVVCSTLLCRVPAANSSIASVHKRECIRDAYTGAGERSGYSPTRSAPRNSCIIAIARTCLSRTRGTLRTRRSDPRVLFLPAKKREKPRAPGRWWRSTRRC